MTSVTRKVFIGADWKCNGDRAFVNSQSTFISNIEFDKKTTELCVAIPNIHLLSAKVILTGKVFVAAQNVSMFDNGPYTGEVSAKQLMDIGVDWVMIGHSERRINFKEDEKVLTEKLKRAFEAGMKVIFCIGDNTEQRDAGKSYEVLEAQLDTLIAQAGDHWDGIVIEYEALWAMGTGKNIPPGLVQEAHEHIRNYLRTKVSDDVAKKTRIIYGGNVNEKNAATLIEKKDIDGFLVGHVSLQKDEFLQVIDACKKKQFVEESFE